MPVAVHCRQEQLRQREGRQNVHREGELVPIRRGLPLLVREDPGVVDEHVQPINLLLDLVGHSSHLHQIREVSRHETEVFLPRPALRPYPRHGASPDSAVLPCNTTWWFPAWASLNA